MGTKSHKKKALKNLNIGIISISSTRTLTNDKSGHWLHKHTKKEGHKVVFHNVIPDDATIIFRTITDVIRDHDPRVLILTGGTGISNKDVTIEAVRPLFTKELTSFGPIFAQLSFEEIDSAAIMSRATAGISGKTIIFCIPGSINACKLAGKALIFPELGHITKHLLEE